MKKCFKCKKEKPLSEFYVHKRMKDGYLNKCKECNKIDVKENYQKNVTNPEFVEKERKRCRDKHLRLYSRALKHYHKYTIKQKWVDKYPEKRIAQIKSQRMGKDKPVGSEEKHHWSYLKDHWQDVIWLTKKHHMKSHRFLIYDQERFMYRRFDTLELLDTKERHEAFIKYCIKAFED